MRPEDVAAAVGALRHLGLTADAQWYGRHTALPPSHGRMYDLAPRLAVPHAPEPSAGYTEARLRFDQRQYREAAAALAGEPDADSTFLRLYSLFLAADLEGQARQSPQPADFLDTACAEEMQALHAECQQAAEAQPGSPFLLLVLAMTAKATGAPAAAVNQHLVRAIALRPANWAAWARLEVASERQLAELRAALPAAAPLYPFFMAKALLELQKDATPYLRKLSARHASSRFVQFGLALNLYNTRHFEAAAKHFARLYAEHPAALDHAGAYANALFVLGHYPELASLANRCVRINRFSAETCCVLGNLWSLTGKHDQAAISFRRALRMNPRVPSGWVLVGHEYVELRNPSAAIASYLRGTQVSPADHRAWFGLGQVYDLLGSPAQAADYYRRAADLCPLDSRLWAALGAVFEAEEMYDHALDSYSNALACPDADSKLYMRVGQIFEAVGQPAEAVDAFHKFLGTARIDQVPFDDEDKALAVLAIVKHRLSTGQLADCEAVLKGLSTLQNRHGQEALQIFALYFNPAPSFE